MSIPTQLNENHKRAIQSTLQMFDQMLCLFEKWAARQETHSILYEEINMLTDEQCQSLTSEIKAIRDLMIQLRDDLELPKRNQDIGQAIHAMSLVFISDDLLSLNKQELEHYGKEATDLVAYLNPKVTELIHRLEHIAKIGKDASKNKR